MDGSDVAQKPGSRRQPVSDGPCSKKLRTQSPGDTAAGGTEVTLGQKDRVSIRITVSAEDETQSVGMRESARAGPEKVTGDGQGKRSHHGAKVLDRPCG